MITKLSPEQEFLLNQLTKPRSGWINHGIPKSIAETVREHTIKVIEATEIFATAARGFKPRLAAQYAISHDFPEIISPDYTPHDKITPEEKHRIEFAAIQSATARFGIAGEEIVAYWLAYEKQNSPTSRIVYQLDKVDPAIQALEYAKQGFNVSDFIPYARNKISDHRLRCVFEETVARANERNAYETYFSLLRTVK